MYQNVFNKKSFRNLFFLTSFILLESQSLKASEMQSKQIYKTIFTKQIIDENPCLFSLFSIPAKNEKCKGWIRRESAGVLYVPEQRRLYLGGSDGLLHILSAVNGKSIKNIKLPGSLITKPVLLNGVLYFGTDDANAIAFDIKTDKILWSQPLDAEVQESVTIDSGYMYLMTGFDSLYKIDLSDGKIIWQHKEILPSGISLKGQSKPAVISTTKGKFIFAGFASGLLKKINLQTGEMLNNHSLAEGANFHDVDADIIWDGKNLWSAGYSSQIKKFNPDNLEVISSIDEKNVVQLQYAPGGILLAAKAKSIVAYNVKTNKKIWQFDFQKGAPSTIVIKSGRVHFSSDKSSMFVLDLRSGEPLQFHGNRFGISAPLEVYRDAIFIFTNAGELQALSNARLEN